MKTSQTGINLIKEFEGVELHAYKPVSTEVHYTIGYGSYGSHVTKDMVISKEEAEELLKKDLVRFEEAVTSYVTVSINQNQFDALVSFAFNLGQGSLQRSTLLKLLNNNDHEGASNEFWKWRKAGGKVLQGLVRRRAAEKDLFIS